MKPLLTTAIFTSTLLLSLTSFAALDKEPCRTQNNMRMKINSISSNIANVGTTRTPEGGPYQKRELICKAQYCVVVNRNHFITKHDPAHPDADSDGNVRYPDIDLKAEVSAMNQALLAYDDAVKNCRTHRLAKNN